VNQAVEPAFYELVVTAAEETILSGYSVDETRAMLTRRWPRLSGETIEQVIGYALVDCDLAPDPLAPPGSGIEVEDMHLHPSWCG
jgi:hypothetical protein